MHNSRISFRGLIHRIAGFLLIGLLAPVTAAQEPTSSDLTNQAGLPIEGGVLDLIYPVQDMGGAASATGQKEGNVAGGGQSLGGEVIDLKAAGADIQESANEIKISLQGEILFDFDKSDLRSAAEPTLEQIAALIKKTTKPNVLVEGYTDAKGSQSYNLKLSERRAASVRSWMVAHGIPPASVRTAGFGAAKPVAPNKKPDGSDDPAGRQKNRRVEITIHK